MTDLELREAVAVEVMGWRLATLIPGGLWWFDGKRPVASVGDPDHDGPPAYESSIEAALAVVEKMREKGFWCEMRNQFTAKNDADCWAGFTPLGVTGWNGEPDNWTRASTIPLAICRAALRAVRAK